MLAQLKCGFQQYDWGKLGEDSKVAQFAAAEDPSLQIDPAAPYAELWMGTHPKAPSIVKGGAGEDLRTLLKQHPEYLGDAVAKKFGEGELPFLFKVLSIRKALSIQAHPDKALGKELRARDPKNYPDDNHKPEMALALTDFEGFCGFRPPAEIASFLESVPEFAELTGKAGVDFVAAQKRGDVGKPELRTLFAAVMETPEAVVESLAGRLATRAKQEREVFAGPHGGKTLADLIVRVNEQFPNDVGLFCGGLMLNYCQLRTGQAMFLRAKDPHAYISGDIIECMAASDNVVRAGFTPKFKDVPTLVNMLTYDAAPVSEQTMAPQPFERCSGEGATAELFNPPIDEFSIVLVRTTKTAKLASLSGPSIFIVTQGSGTLRTDKGELLEYGPGFVFFAAAGTPFEIQATQPTVSYHAFVEV